MRGRRAPPRPQRSSSPPGNQIPSGRWTIGLHSVKEALKVRPQAVKELWLKEGWESSEDLREIGEQARNVKAKPQGVMDKLGHAHQGVAALMAEAPVVSWSELETAQFATVLLADGIQDPHNLGAILRTAWLLGAKALFIPEHRASPLTPTAMKVASGGAEHVAVEAEGNLLSTAKQLKDIGFWLYGLAGDGKGSLWQQSFPEKVALVVGNEESGIRTPLARLCDELIHIPQADSAASFNASVATAIALAEVTRQRHQLSKKP